MSIIQLKKELEFAIQNNDYNKVEFLLLHRFPNPESIIKKTQNPAILNKNITKKQLPKFKDNYEFIKFNRNCFNKKKKLKNQKKNICYSIANKLYALKTIGWSTGLRSSTLGSQRSSRDHIFPRNIVAQYYLMKKKLSEEYFKYTFCHLFGLTIKVTSNENKRMYNSLKLFFNNYNSNRNLIDIIPNILPVIAYCYKMNKILLQNTGNHKMSINMLRNYVISLFL